MRRVAALALLVLCHGVEAGKPIRLVAGGACGWWNPFMRAVAGRAPVGDLAVGRCLLVAMTVAAWGLRYRARVLVVALGASLMSG